MKTNLRFILVAVVLACIAALGFSHVARADCGTVPCTPLSGDVSTAGGTINLGTVVVTVPPDTGAGSVTATETTVTSADYPSDPSLLRGYQVNSGAGVTITIKDDQGNPLDNISKPLTISFANEPGGAIYRWTTPSELAAMGLSGSVGTWLPFPGYIKDGMICTQTFVPGLFAILSLTK